MAEPEAILWTNSGAAAAIAPRAGFGPEALKILTSDLSPRRYAEALLKAELSAEAMKLIPFAFPRREAVWWVAQSLRSVPDLLDPKGVAAIESVEKWCANPTDENRRAAMVAAEVADVSTPAGCTAMAVFLCEGSLAPPQFEKVSAPPDVGFKMAGNAALLAAVIKEPEDAPQRYAKFMELADAVAARTNRWTESTSASATGTAFSSAPQPRGAREFPPYPQSKGRLS